MLVHLSGRGHITPGSTGAGVCDQVNTVQCMILPYSLLQKKISTSKLAQLASLRIEKLGVMSLMK